VKTNSSHRLCAKPTFKVRLYSSRLGTIKLAKMDIYAASQFTVSEEAQNQNCKYQLPSVTGKPNL
jgi:hypothetical protein